MSAPPPSSKAPAEVAADALRALGPRATMRDVFDLCVANGLENLAQVGRTPFSPPSFSPLLF
jgi:hypothetical protein